MMLLLLVAAMRGVRRKNFRETGGKNPPNHYEHTGHWSNVL